MAKERVGREIDAAARGVHRQRPHQAGQAIGEARLRGRRFERRTARPETLAAERKQCAGRLGEIGLERAPVGHDLGLDVEVAGVDQRVDALA